MNIPNFNTVKTILTDTFKKPLVITIVVLSVLLLTSIAINIYLVRTSESKSSDIEQMRIKETELFNQNKQLEDINKTIQEEKNARSIQIDSLKKIINKYDTEKNNRKHATSVVIKKSNNLSAHESLDNFLQWTEKK